MNDVNDNLKYEEFVITQGTNKLDARLVDEYFIKQVGNISCAEFINKPYIGAFFDGDINTLVELSDNVFAELSALITHLWFSKDGSVSLGTIHFYIPEQKRVLTRSKTSHISNAKGEFSQSEVTQQDIDFASEILAKFLKVEKRPINQHPPGNYVNKTLSPAFYKENYNLHNRLDKCLIFLTTARHQSYLPLKIASYMSIFECLFTIDSLEVTHKVAERAAIYLDADPKKTFEYFKQIKFAYGYRSKFLHGQQFKKNKDSHEHLIEISTAMDDILRKILIKAILIDYEILTTLDDTKLDDYFNEKLFSYSRKL